MPEWTNEQKTAIETTGTNILLSAAAGSGKTTVLVERVIRLIENGADIDRMLIVTFTRASASDMREKFGEKLRELIKQQPRFRRQLLLLEHASISTIHSFCSDFLRSNFESADVDPSFRLVNDTELNDMTERALDRAMEEAYTDPTEGMKALNFARGPKTVRKMVLTLLNALNEQPEPEEWLDRVCTQGPDLRALWIGELTQDARNAIEKSLVQYRKCLEHPECNELYASVVARDIEALTDILNKADDYETLRCELENFRQTPAKGGGKRVPAIGEIPKQHRAKAKSIIEAAVKRGIPLEPAFRDIDALTPALKALGNIAMRTRDILTERKREMGVLTFNDLEHFAIRALKDDAAAESVRARYDYVFVDEYQDTSALQDYLVSRITRGDNLFMVGDVKQSIYRFRHADPTLFMDKYERYAQDGESGTLLHLTRNFRSCPAILDFVNCIFEKCMHGGETEILYDQNARLNHGNAKLQGGNVELHILKKPSAKDPEDEEDDSDQTDIEAAFIAARIHELRRESPDLKFSDIAVIARSGKGVFARIASILTSMGIPAYAPGSESYYESMEVILAYALLNLIKNRRLDVELIGVLHSPIVGITADELAQIRICYPDISFSEAVERYAKEKEDAVAARLSRFLTRLDLWRDLAQSSDLGYFTDRVFAQSGLYNIAHVLPGAVRRTANLDRIVSDAAAYEKNICGSLTSFMNIMEIKRSRGEVGDISTVSENEDVVRIMTAHSSKGLEFRVVFGALLSKKRNRAEDRDPLTVHTKLGLSCQYTDPELRSRRKTLCRHAVSLRTARESSAEELRILYVLLTRAKEQLILIGSVPDPEKTIENIYKITDPASYLETILSALPETDMPCSLKIHTERVMPDPADMQIKTSDPDIQEDTGITEAIQWQYPYAKDAMLPLKLSVSGILRTIHEPSGREHMESRPAFLKTSAGKLTGTEKGTAYHRVIQCLDLSRLQGLSRTALEKEIASQQRALLEQKRIFKVERDAVKSRVLADFFAGDIGRRMTASPEVRREWSFNVRMNIPDVLSPEETDIWKDGEIMVQGTIDACFREGDAWVLLDFKTDRETDAAALTDRYADQLRMYAYALRVSTGIPVSQIALCLIMQNETIRIDL